MNQIETTKLSIHMSKFEKYDVTPCSAEHRLIDTTTESIYMSKFDKTDVTGCNHAIYGKK